MKVFIFRCRTRPEVQAASRYETGSNLPRGECSDGWLFSELVDLKTERRSSRLGVDITELRRGVQERGYHVWGAGTPLHTAAASKVPVASPSFTEVNLEPVALAPALDASNGAAHGAVPAPPRHQIVWFDIPVRDLDRAIRFYSAVLGILLRKEPAGRGAAMAILPHTDTSIGGCLVQTMDARPSDAGPLLYLNADGRLDAAVAATTIAGGAVLQPKHSIGSEGYRAIVLDTEGNRIALYSR